MHLAPQRVFWIFLVVQGEPSTAALFFFMVFDCFLMVFSYCCTVFFDG